MEMVMKKISAMICMLLVVFSLSAVYITAAAGDDLYIIDKRSGEVLARITDGKVFSVGHDDPGMGYPVETYEETIRKYGLIADIGARFTVNSVYLSLDIAAGPDANENVLQELIGNDASITVRFLDAYGFLLGEEGICLSEADLVYDGDGKASALSIDAVRDGSATLRNLADSIDFTYSFSSAVTPADSFFETRFSVPDWLRHTYYDFEEESIVSFTADDIIWESLDEEDPETVSVKDDIEEVKREFYRDEGELPGSWLFSEEIYGDYAYGLTLYWDDSVFYRTDNPYIVNSIYEYRPDEIDPLLRTDYRNDIAVPEWLIGTWEYGTGVRVVFTENDIVIDDVSYADSASERTIDAYLENGAFSPYAVSEYDDDVYTLVLGGAETTARRTEDPDVIEVSGALVPAGDIITLAKLDE